MTFLEKIYDRSPLFFQNIMVTMSGYQKNKQRYGEVYKEYRKFLTDFDTWDLKRQQEYQNEELIKFIHFAVQNSPFYKRFYAGIDLGEIKNVQDLKKLPVVDKEMLREYMEEVVTISKKGAIIEKTGGTTGKALVIYKTVPDMMKRMAMLDHFKARVGFENKKMKRATFNAKQVVSPRQRKKVFWRYNAASKQMIYTPYRLFEENMKYYVESLNKFKPHALDGQFTSICDIASYIERHKLSLTFTPIAVFPTAETLTQSGRELIERVFKCKVYDQYASSEGAPFLTECPCQTLHMEMASGVFEHFESENEEILVTSFTTHGTPLIRYRIGDAVVFAEQEITTCPCGMAAPVVKEIKGRKFDFLYTAEGAKISGANVAGLFKGLDNAVIRAQAIQDQLDEILILLEVDKTRYEPKHDTMLAEIFRQRFGVNTKLIISHVEQIPREKSGKFQMIKNNVTI